MKQYNPGGKVALLGVQGISSWLLFAQAATECASDLTADCLLQKAGSATGWTGGGLHAPQTPGNTEPSDCWLALSLGADGFSLNKTATKANKGLYNCKPENVIPLKGG
ncbi:MAG: branched-chain amino acid ABC transporter substrate-binding protein, partial [Acidimicrobiales bacterium]